MPRLVRCLGIAFAVILLASVPLTVAAQDAPAGAESFWWNERVFYQIFVRSFYDSDGDGTGDFQGLIQKLDYLNDGDPSTSTDLGINGIWLMPIMASPSEHGYDITDYYAVNPDYGTVDDFRQFIDAAHQRGIAVIIDLVINHTSEHHPWFLASRNRDPQYADYYVWSDTDPGFRGPESQTVWHRKGDRFVYGVFNGLIPDLNFTNPAVTAEMYAIAEFWLEEMGVDGFRVDAVKYVVEEGRALENTVSTHDWLAAFHSHIRAINPDALLVGEIWDSTSTVVRYVGGEMDIAFEFDLAVSMVRSATFALSGTLVRGLEPVLRAYPPGQYATFLTNHDQDRLFSQAQNNLNSARLGAAFLLTTPGVPFVYYGEEIAMEGKRTLPSTDNERRTPMQWEDSANAGFTSGTPWFPINASFHDFNVAELQADPASVLNLYRDLIQLRVRTPALQSGGFTLITSASRKVLAFARHTAGQTVIVLVNTDDAPVLDYALSGTLPITSVSGAVSLYGYDHPGVPELAADGSFTAYQPFSELPPFSVMIYELFE